MSSPRSDLASAIRSLQHKVMSSDDDPVCLEVRRNCLLIDSIFCTFLGSNFGPLSMIMNMLQVNFVGESAIDHGGPRREYSSEEFFQGRLGCKFFVVALQVKFLRVCALLKGTVVEDGQLW